MLVKIIDKVEDYGEGIKISCNMLKEKGIIEEKYYNAIMSKIDEFGPYFCIADGVAMPHARPEDGSIETGVSVVKLNNPVDFLGKKISVFFTLSAKDNESHLGLLRQIAEVCMNKDKLNKIINSNNEKEIMEVF
ncbi:PTS sugar transporter subunit IIA [Clostridium thermobutyricum]|uniref:Ascorbate-specific PTS system EIIA component n=1 Tax=Clostridium thermobutyricum DSM 4928 TaxID=1121339 RepID=A0A1V4SVS5_9CLOT|nr:PTS sugar transporter subunit IIA [Clostridium thermobutyricum]OPX48196.1 ascorbate-specific phosphotransferase enzyme IIA component [Clostridium thermobutyricum DSM 4928]